LTFFFGPFFFAGAKGRRQHRSIVVDSHDTALHWFGGCDEAYLLLTSGLAGVGVVVYLSIIVFARFVAGCGFFLKHYFLPPLTGGRQAGGGGRLAYRATDRLAHLLQSSRAWFAYALGLCWGGLVFVFSQKKPHTR
jgi:hypothetical protein